MSLLQMILLALIVVVGAAFLYGAVQVAIGSKTENTSRVSKGNKFCILFPVLVILIVAFVVLLFLGK